VTERGSAGNLRRLWDAYAWRYDRDIRLYDRLLLGDSRSWICSKARGEVLEVAVGTGRNLPFYPPDTRLIGIDLSAAMLAVARGKADQLGVRVMLAEADAQHLPFDDARFDTIVCTLALSSISDPRMAIGEMYRVLRVNGRLLVLGHVGSPNRVVRVGQYGLERLSVRLAGDYQTRQPYPNIVAAGFSIEERQQLKAGIIERLIASKRQRQT